MKCRGASRESKASLHAYEAQHRELLSTQYSGCCPWNQQEQMPSASTKGCCCFICFLHLSLQQLQTGKNSRGSGAGSMSWACRHTADICRQLSDPPKYKYLPPSPPQIELNPGIPPHAKHSQFPIYLPRVSTPVDNCMGQRSFTVYCFSVLRLGMACFFFFSPTTTYAVPGQLVH